jgi:hypothetical protein
VTMGDHPMCVVSSERKNSKTTNYNYLRSLCDARTFYTVFSARDPQGNYQHLAHFQWDATWDFQFQWSGWGSNLSSIASAQTGFKLGPVTAGAPTAKSLAPLLKDPTNAEKLGTNEQNQALLAALKGAPTMIENSTYFGTVPDNFWR